MDKKRSNQWISGFWKRFAAFVLDTILLGIVGLLLGLVFEKQFVELGAWGRLVGFIVALLYFGLLNSNIFNGQTLGKRLLKIRVVDKNNNTISLPKSFLRYSILGIPFFLNNAQFHPDVLVSYWSVPISMLVFGGLLSIVYLYVFNRITRQSLHDIIIGTYVIDTQAEKQKLLDMWRSHLYVVALLFLISIVSPLVVLSYKEQLEINSLLVTQNKLMESPVVNYAQLTYGKHYKASINEANKETAFVIAKLFLKQKSLNNEKLARTLALIVLENYKESKGKDVIQINMIYSYDIGIANRWVNKAYNYNPDELLQWRDTHI